MIESFNPQLESSQEEKEGIQKMRLMVMLGARMQNPNGLEGWQFPLFVPNQTSTGTSLPGEVSGGFARMTAVETELRNRKDDKKTMVLVTGGKEKTGESRADEAARQLVDRYGLSSDTVASFGGAGSTLGNVGATMEYIQEHAEQLGKVHEIEIVTNDYHMLRAWIIFSSGILKYVSDNDLDVSPEDKAEIERLLDEGMPKDDTWKPENIETTREAVMKILAPYFSDSPISIQPVVVEEVLGSSVGDDAEAKKRYARMLRNNEWVRKTLEFEYKGIKDLLAGRYKK